MRCETIRHKTIRHKTMSNLKICENLLNPRHLRAINEVNKVGGIRNHLSTKVVLL